MGNTVLLCMQCRVIGPHLAARGKSHDFSPIAAGTLDIFSTYGGDGPSKLMFSNVRTPVLLQGTPSGLSSSLGSAIGTPLEVRQETQGPFQVATGILGFLSIFKRSQTSSPFEALNSTCLSNFLRHVRPPVEMRRAARAFSRLSTGDSNIPSSCQMKDQPAFKSLLGYPALFPVRHLGVHSISGSKLRVPITYLYLTEPSF